MLRANILYASSISPFFPFLSIPFTATRGLSSIPLLKIHLHTIDWSTAFR